MTISRVQGAYRLTSGSGDTVVLGSTPTEGNVLVMVANSFGWNTAGVESITQTGVTWASGAVVTGVFTEGGGNKALAQIFYGVVGSGAGQNVTVVNNANNGFTINVCEYSGLDSSGLVDKTAFTTDQTSVDAVTGTTDQTTLSDELWIGAVCSPQDGYLTSGLNSFVQLDAVSPYGGSVKTGAYLEKIVSSVGEAYTGITLVTSYENAGAIATFKAQLGAAYTAWITF